MSESSPNKAIVIAAGRGQRLMPYTDAMPKCLVPVAGASILEHQLRAFAAHGVTEVVIIRGYLGDVLGQRRAELEACGVHIRFVENRDFEHNNILESLFCAEAELDGPVLLSYSDIIYTPAVVGALLASPGDLALVIDSAFRDVYVDRTDHPLEQAEVADLDAAGHVHRVGKLALPPDDAFGEFIGLMKLTAAGTERLRQSWRGVCDAYAGREEAPFQRAARFRNAYLTDLLQHMIEAGVALSPVEIRGQWREIDTVQDLERAEELLGSALESWK